MTILTVENLVLKKNKDVTILKGLNAKFESGKLNAIMGPNGCGKTTFLNIIFGNITSDIQTSGNVLIDGVERDKDSWFSEVSYVHQNSFMLENQTVREAMQFSLDMRNETMNTDKKLEDFKSLIEILLLTDLMDTSIDVLSGGERKRALIALEMVTMSKILFLDEPTSDLDSHLALKLIVLLKKVAKEMDLMIIFTIHKPSDQIYKQFDNLLFMKDGKTIYNGESGEMMEFLRSFNIQKPENWVSTDFIFEAFYGRTRYPEIAKCKNAIDMFLNEIDKKSTAVVNNSITSYKGESEGIDLSISLGKAIILFNRFIIRILKSKAKRNQIIFAAPLPLINIVIGYLKAYLNSEKDTIVKGVSYFEIFSGRSEIYENNLLNPTKKEAVPKTTIFEIIFSNFIYPLLNFLPMLSLNFESGFVWMKQSLKHEIQKRIYSTTTLCLASVFSQFLINISAFFIVTAIFILSGNFKYINNLFGLLCIAYYLTAFFSQILVEVITSNDGVFSFIAQMLGIAFKAIVLYSYKFNAIYSENERFLPKNMKFIVSCIALSFMLLNPSTFLILFIVAMYLKKFTFGFRDIDGFKFDTIEMEQKYFSRFKSDANCFQQINVKLVAELKKTVYSIFSEFINTPYHLIIGFLISLILSSIIMTYFFAKAFSLKTCLKL